MIRVPRELFWTRVSRAGKDRLDVLPCVIGSDGDFLIIDASHESYPFGRPGLGDMVAAGLSAVGITKDRVSALVGGDCGCGARQATLNAVGAKYLGLPEGSTASKTTLDS